MIYLYSGVPGSGKSYHMAKDIKNYIIDKKLYCISNVQIDYNKLCKFTAVKPSEARKRLFCLDNDEITVDYLKDFSRRYLQRGKENQCLLVFDEAGDKFNPRTWDSPDRAEWLKFFRVHRHYGYKILLVAQHDRYIDRQIRGCIQTEVEHRSFKYYHTFGFILYKLFGGLFQTIQFNYPMKGQSRSSARESGSIIRLRKSIANIYDTFACFDEFDEPSDGVVGGMRFTASGDPATPAEQSQK